MAKAYALLGRQDLVPLLYALRVPSIVDLHTVLERPSARQRAIPDDIIDAASAVVTMTRTASHPPMALTWGLLGPGTGIEHAIAAVALLRDRGRRVAHDGAVA
jgi:hypothetical protein